MAASTKKKNPATGRKPVSKAQNPAKQTPGKQSQRQQSQKQQGQSRQSQKQQGQNRRQDGQRQGSFWIKKSAGSNTQAAPKQVHNTKALKQTAITKAPGTTKAQTKNMQPKKVKTASEFPLKKEIIIIATLAICILILISCFAQEEFAIGWLKIAVFSVFGYLSYIVPFLLFYMVCFILSNQGDRRIIRKLIGGLLCFVSICGIAQLLSSLEDGGGWIGEFLVFCLRPLLGALGAYVVMLCLIAIGIVMITERSVMRFFANTIRQVVLFFRQKTTNFRGTKDDREKTGKRKPTFAQIPPQEEKAGYLENMDIPISGMNNGNGEPVSDQDKKEQEAELQKDAVWMQQELPLDELKGGSRNYGYSEGPDIIPVLNRFRKTEIKNAENNGGAEDFIQLQQKRKQAKASDSSKLDSAESDSSKLDSAESDSSKLDSAESDSSKLDSAELDSSKLDSAELDSSKLNAVSPNASRRKEEKDKPGMKTVVTANGKVITVEVDGVPGAKPVKRQVPQQKKKEERKKTTSDFLPKPYIFPPLELLSENTENSGIGPDKNQVRGTAFKLKQTLEDFGVDVKITNISCGPAVTRYELQPGQGIKVSKIVSLTDDIKLNLAAADIRMEAPIPGKAAIGIEVPNKENQTVLLRNLLSTKAFQHYPSKISFAVGMDIAGNPVISDIAKMPHLLIAGATGSGKSVCINTLIMSILYKAKPTEVKMIMIDPKVVELSVYNGIPHLMIPVVTDPKKAAGALNWAVTEMTDRYQRFAELNVRDRAGYNKKIEQLPPIEGEEMPAKLPEIVIIIDELADLMMVVPSDVEDAICRLAQMARAAGIHLVIATQRPSVNVVTGLIKANVPSRIAFSVSSGVDSRTIIDMNGAEKLLGRGDMLFYPSGYQKPERVQGAYVSDFEVAAVVKFLSRQVNIEGAEQDEQLDQKIMGLQRAEAALQEQDEYFARAGEFVIEKEKASIGMLQRVFKIGFNRAARIVDQLAAAGVVGEEEGTKPRKILMTIQEFNDMIQGKQ